jgi:hypothetical protein
VKPAPTLDLSAQASEARLDRYGLRVAAHLSEHSADLPADIGERLRVAREQAVERAHASRRAVGRLSAAPTAAGGGGTLTLGSGDGEGGFLSVLARWVPIALLIAGLIGIQDLQQRFVASATAEIDGDILTDDLPPSAYGDPGFAEFLKMPPAAAD